MNEPITIVIKAAHFAADKHRDQRRKDIKATPYINHPLALAQILSEEGGITDPLVIAAALLHDTVEDTETTFEELEAAFGKVVANVVREVTDDKTMEKSERKQAQVDHAPSISHRAKLVKLADRIANCRDLISNPPHEWDEDRRREYFEWSSRVVNAMGNVQSVLQAKFREVVEQGLAADPVVCLKE